MGPHKQQLATVAIHEILVSEEFTLHRVFYVLMFEKKSNKKEACIKQLYPLGYRKEFDFGEVKCLISQQKRILTLAVFSCPAFGYRWGKFYESPNQQVFLYAHKWNLFINSQNEKFFYRKSIKQKLKLDCN